MRRIRVAGLCLVAAFAMSALASSSAFAKAKVLTAKTAKGPLVKGQELKASSSNLIFVTESGNLECTNNVLTGEVETNNATKDKGKVTKEESTGGEAGGLCKTTTPLGPAKITSKAFPWPVVFTNAGVNEVKGTKAVTFESEFPGAKVICIFESKLVKSTFNTSGVVTITTKEQTFVRSKKGSNTLCPKEGKLSGTFDVTSNGEPVESELK